MTGNELKRKLLSEGVGITELAGRLGLSQQAFSNRLTVKNVKPEFIRQIEEIVGFKINPVTSNSTETQQFIDLLKKKDEQMDRLIALLEQKYAPKDTNGKRAAV